MHKDTSKWLLKVKFPIKGSNAVQESWLRSASICKTFGMLAVLRNDIHIMLRRNLVWLFLMSIPVTLLSSLVIVQSSLVTCNNPSAFSFSA